MGSPHRTDTLERMVRAVQRERIRGPKFWLISLEPLVRMKLTAHRLKDRVHIRDLIGVGLVDDTWPDRFPPMLGERLRAILADPDG